MGCGCAERRIAIVKGIKAAATGDMKALAQQAQVFSKTIRTDTRNFGGKIALARASLARR